MTTPTNTVSTVSTTDVVSAVTSYVSEFKRPCPASYLTGRFGDPVEDVIAELKASGILLGLRGRNGGLALMGSDIVAKRAEHGIKKAAKLAEKVPGLEIIEPAEQVGAS